MAKITKKQRSALKEIEKIKQERKRDWIFGLGSLGVMVVLIIAFNTLGYNLGVIDPNNPVIRAMMYITALVFAGYSGIKLMHASQKKRKIDGLRQQAAISYETMTAWEKGEID